MATNERKHLLSHESLTIKKENAVEEDDYQIVKKAEEVPVCCSYRLGVIICCTLSMTITYAAQASLSAAMVCMIEDRHKHEGDGVLDNVTTQNGTTDTFYVTSANTTESHDKDWLFTWDKSKQGLALSAFFMGYYVSQIPSSIAAARFGPKRVVVVSLILVSVFQGLTVPAAYFGVGWLYADRIIVGIIDGFLYAPTFALAGQWAPRHETSLLFGIVGMGMELGNVLSYATSLLGCEIIIQEGWPFVFYILAGLGLIVAALFMIIVSDSPFNNGRISRKEVKFIASCIPKRQPTPDEALIRVPVKEVLSSMCVWAIVVSQIGSDWLYYFFVTMEPTFLKDVIKLTNAEVNLLSGIPFLGIIPTIYLAGYLCDKLVIKGIISNTKIRKINDFICKIVPSAILIGLGFLPQESIAAAFVLNLLGAMCMGFSYVSWMANPVDLAPAYTGFIVGVCEIGAIWVAIAVPIVFDEITVDRTREQWQLMFYITGGIQLFCFLFYAVFASGELQPWAVTTPKQDYDDLDGQVDASKHLVEEATTLRSHSKVSAGRNKSSDEETQRLLSSLSLSLGDFRGTSSYEASMKKHNETRKQVDDVASNTVVISGPAITRTALQSGHILTEDVLGQRGLYLGTSMDAMIEQMKLKNGNPGYHASNGAPIFQIPRASSAGLGVLELEAENYIESDDDSWQHIATRSLPNNLTRSILYGRGDHDIHSTVSSPLTSGRFDHNLSSGPLRNVKSLAAEIAETLSIHSLNEPKENGGHFKPTTTGTKVRQQIPENLKTHANIRNGKNESDSGITKWQDVSKKLSEMKNNIGSKHSRNIKNLKRRNFSSNMRSPGKGQPHAPGTSDPHLNDGNTSSIMVPSEEFLDTVEMGSWYQKNADKNRLLKARSVDGGNKSQNSGHKDSRQIAGIVRSLFSFGRSKSNPHINLPDEDTFVFVNDDDVKATYDFTSWATKSFDSTRKPPSIRTQNLKGEKNVKITQMKGEDDEEQVLFAYPRQKFQTDTK